jgi:plasmid stabilization system protein ParE
LALTVRVKPRARREINEAAAWWGVNRLAAPGAVAQDLREALDLLVEFPGLGTRVENAKSSDTRRWLLQRISYHIYYRVRANTLEVVAFWGTARERGPRV